GKNFAVCGPNGTGKSCIVDAIEFGLTGNISRLSGKGRGVVSVREHAPHVNSRNNPDKARVIITAIVSDSNKRVVIDRTVKDSNNPTVTPNDPSTLQILHQVANHPEFVLSRRELILYILATPGERSKEIQALLKLDKIEELRALFVKIANAHKKETAPLKTESKLASDNLIQALEITTLNPEEVLKAVNPRRAILNLPPLTALTATTSLRDGLETITNTPQTFRVPKAQAIIDIKSLSASIDSLHSTENIQSYQAIAKELGDFVLDPIANQNVSLENFLRSALQFLDESICPVCDTPWNLDDLKQVIENKLKNYDAVSKRRIELENKLVPIITSLQSLQNSISLIKTYKLTPTTSAEIQKLAEFEKQCVSKTQTLSAFFPVASSINILDHIHEIPQEITDAIVKLSASASAMPEPTVQDSARDFLTICQERLEVYRSAQRRLRQADEKAKLTDKISTTYAQVSNAILNDIYKQVEQQFSEFYRVINHDDEPGFSAQLLPSAGKLGFDVDFYGKGFFPPGAYHSEGHQDGMGLCLYLALMKHISGKGFTLAVLDDVLMSVDSGHRREVCALLSQYFPDTQFVLTTHDQVWLKHMKTVGLIGQNASIRFRTWNVNIGPTEWEQKSVWDEIDSDLQKDDVRSAAGLLRHFLEYIFGEACHRLRAPVEFRGDSQYQVGDLMPCAVLSLQNLYKEAIDAATSWGNTQLVQEITDRKNALASALTTAGYDQWQINGTIHFHEWDNLSKQDFAPVVEAFKKLIQNFNCPDCACLFEILPDRGHKKTVKCTCGSTNINLERKMQPDTPSIPVPQQGEVVGT
ncbi:MAG: AAA family ATPase, partial [Patescibacteria group bacterium]